MTTIAFTAVNKWVGDLFGRRHILRDVSFELPTGTVCGLVGHNGAGKSTLISLATGLAAPTSGTVTIDGVSPLKTTGRRGLGFAAEHPEFPATLTAREVLALHLRLLGKDPRAGDELLEHLGLATTTQWIGTWSKGMRQRLALAVAMVGEPGLLILDEPMSGLDPIGRAVVRKAIISEKERGASIVFSSHVLSDVAAICNRVLVVRSGALVLDEPLLESRPRWLITTHGVDEAGLAAFAGAGVTVNADATLTVDDDAVWATCAALQHRAVAIGSVVQQHLDLERRVLPLLEANS